MSGTKFSVSWEAYKKSICNGLSFLQQREEFVDMTIAADGHMVRVHRMVMSLISPFIKELISSAQCPHPVVFLNRVSYNTLQLILEYAYTGEVLVPHESLNDFLEVCNSLHIKGLENMAKQDIQTAYVDPDDENTQDDSRVSINVSQLATTETEMEGDDNYDSHIMDEDDGDQDTSITNKEKQKGSDTLGKTSLQYSLSNQGTLQLILNRYIYCQRYTRKDNSRMWRCFQHKNSCPASVTTRGNQVVGRLGAHNHPYHDEQILKRVKKNNVFAVEPRQHQILAKKVIDKAQEVKKLL